MAKVTVAKIAYVNTDERYGGQEYVYSLQEYRDLNPDSEFEMTRDEIVEITPAGDRIAVAKKVVISTEQREYHSVLDVADNVRKSGKWLVRK